MNTPSPADTEGAGRVVAGTRRIAAAHGRWRRGRGSSRPRVFPPGLSPRRCATRGRGSGVGGRSTGHGETVQRVARRAVYAASAFRYEVMRVIMPAHAVRRPDVPAPRAARRLGDPTTRDGQEAAPGRHSPGSVPSMASHTTVDRAQRLAQLHAQHKPLVLPTVWDAWSARTAVDAGFLALTIGSHPLADSRGAGDQEGQTYEDVLAAVRPIIAAVDVPVSVDLEAGYGQKPADLIAGLIEVGGVGSSTSRTHRARLARMVRRAPRPPASARRGRFRRCRGCLRRDPGRAPRLLRPSRPGPAQPRTQRLTRSRTRLQARHPPRGRPHRRRGRPPPGSRRTAGPRPDLHRHRYGRRPVADGQPRPPHPRAVRDRPPARSRRRRGGAPPAPHTHRVPRGNDRLTAPHRRVGAQGWDF
ncbi:hypothetical protein SALBM217S_06661 [Streptomyces griseoloalbus]